MGISYITVYTYLLLVLSLFLLATSQDALNEDVIDEKKFCEQPDDLDFERCKPENLQIPALKTICENIGLDAETDVFPFLFEEEDVKEDGALLQKLDREFVHADYVAAAYECISVAEESDHEEAFIQAILEEDPAVLQVIIKEVMESSPGTIEGLIKEFTMEFPDIEAELSEGETFLDSPVLVVMIIKALLHEDTIFDWDAFLDNYDLNDDAMEMDIGDLTAQEL
mmetsp:Transcript_8057/g.11700  ORF Transcript_8057/g.11700 Transcript_8057/m.11700 type:complete len:225 (+) Transcript_8057:156-830(+)